MILLSGQHALERTFLKLIDGSFCLAIALLFCIFNDYKTVEQKLSHKCAMIHSQDVNIPDKNCNLFSGVTSLPSTFSLQVQLNRS